MPASDSVSFLLYIICIKRLKKKDFATSLSNDLSWYMSNIFYLPRFGMYNAISDKLQVSDI